MLYYLIDTNNILKVIKVKKIINIIGAFIFCMALTSCSSAGGISTFTAAVEEMPKNFDPQIASESSDLLVITNIFDGLYEKINGEIVPVLAEKTDISSDGKTYTISIKKGTVFNYKGDDKSMKDLPVTAHDFVFAINRILDPKTHSPYIDDFSNISSIKAKDDYTLVINLKHPDYNFTEKLCMPAAFPCNEKFFNTTGGAYGLSVENILSNGPFRLNYLDTENGNATIVRTNEDKGLSRIRIKELTSSEQSEAYKNDEISGFFSYSSKQDNFENTAEISYNSSIISLVYNPVRSVFGNENVRKALGWYAFEFENSGANKEAVEGCKTIFPDAISVAGKYINQVVTPETPSYMSQNPKELMATGLSQSGVNRIENVTVLIPNDSIYSIVYENVNQLWQKNLGQFFKVESLPSTQIKQRVVDGDFDIAFLPLTSDNDTPYGMLDKFSHFNSEVMSLTEMAKSKSNQADSIPYIAKAQNIILDSALSVPMGSEKTVFYYENYFENIYVNPFNHVINLKHTVAK